MLIRDKNIFKNKILLIKYMMNEMKNILGLKEG